MAPKLRISIIQFEPKPLSPASNFAHASEQIRLAAAGGSHLAILPEYHLTSWVPSSPSFATCCANSAPYLSRYQALAKELNIHIVPGTIIARVAPLSLSHNSASAPTNNGPNATAPPPNASPNPNPPPSPKTPPFPPPALELHNMTYLLAAGSGAILASYQKRNLWHPERGVLTPGGDGGGGGDLETPPHIAFNLPIPGTADDTVRAGLLVCWDLAFPEPFRLLACQQGAELILVPAFWHITRIDPGVAGINRDSEVAFLDAAVVARAYENTCAVVLCNALGRSQVAVPIGGCLGALGVGEDGVLEREVDFGVVRFAESVYKVRADVKGEGWYRGKL